LVAVADRIFLAQGSAQTQSQSQFALFLRSAGLGSVAGAIRAFLAQRSVKLVSAAVAVAGLIFAVADFTFLAQGLA
jgi:hypothetical protein